MNLKFGVLFIFCSIGLVSVTTCPKSLIANDETAREALGVISSGYLANREAFSTIDCRFTVVRGKAETLEDAQQGVLGQQEPEQRGHWLVSGNLSRYELLCHPSLANSIEQAVQDSDSAEGLIRIACADMLYLREDGRYTLRHSPNTLTANLFTVDDQDATGIRFTPFNMDVMGADEFSNPARYINDALSGRWDFRYVGAAISITGRPMLVCELGPQYRVRMGFDPNRGYMLVMFSDTDPDQGRRIHDAHVLEARQCSNGSWFPTRTVTIRDPDGPLPLNVDLISVDKLETDLPPSLDKFTLNLAEGVQVNRPGHPEWINLKVAESITVQNLADLHQRCITHGLERNAFDARESNPQHLLLPLANSGFWRSLIIVNLILVSIISILIVLKIMDKKNT